MPAQSVRQLFSHALRKRPRRGPSFRLWTPVFAIWLPLWLAPAGPPPAAHASAPEAEARTALGDLDVQPIQDLVDELRGDLSIVHEVAVSIVAENALIVSVESAKDRSGAFLLSFEHTFLQLLSEDELRAVIAHELGHVWIFTNHPYLQTEQLANRIAMRVVSRESLAQVYEKVWKHGGTKGDLARFLGE